MTTARRAGAVSAATLSGLALTLGFAHAVAPTWVRGSGLDLWNLRALRESAREGEDNAVALQQKHDQLSREIETSEHVAARLIDGSLTLAGAIDELSPLLEVRGGFESAARQRFGTETFRQTVAAYVIDKANQLLAADPTRRPAVSARLRAEFAAIK